MHPGMNFSTLLGLNIYGKGVKASKQKVLQVQGNMKGDACAFFCLDHKVPPYNVGCCIIPRLQHKNEGSNPHTRMFRTYMNQPLKCTFMQKSNI